VESKAQTRGWGEHPKGLLLITPGGRWVAIQTAEEHEAATDDPGRAAAFPTMLAYAGNYRVERDTILIMVDISWDESWMGTEQVRLFKLEGDELHIEAPPQPYANFGGRIMRGILTWRKLVPHQRGDVARHRARQSLQIVAAFQH
jgi:Lipocalin-like domain